jgi:hypothetical protein
LLGASVAKCRFAPWADVDKVRFGVPGFPAPADSQECQESTIVE